jgi:transcriptional regulator with PAS, ATPase and Fis domain
MTATAPPPAELVSLLEQLPGCRLLIDNQYRIVASNSCYRTHCKADSERQVVGRHCYEVSHGYDAPCDQKGESCPLRSVQSSGQPERCVHVHHSAHGEEHVDVELVPLRDAEGNVALYMEHMEPVAPQRGTHGSYVGSAPSFLRTLELIKRVARTDTSVLLLGETGTGKEVMARAVHDLSTRADRPFVVVDCAGLTESLFESELFGHEKGAFTGAAFRKSGLVEAAEGGTLFIDEVGDIPLALQVKLLRLLETGLFRRVGGTEMQRADFRLVAATHRDLAGLVAEGRFRSDLYYRISAFPVPVPPLRERRSDVAALARSILSRLDHGYHQDITPAALEALLAYDYPGNVRELRNILERASLLTEAGWIDVRHLPAHVSCPERDGTTEATRERLPSAGGSPIGSLAQAEREALRHAIREHQGNRRELAEKLGVSERTLYRKLKEVGSG